MEGEGRYSGGAAVSSGRVPITMSAIDSTDDDVDGGDASGRYSSSRDRTPLLRASGDRTGVDTSALVPSAALPPPSVQQPDVIGSVASDGAGVGEVAAAATMTTPVISSALLRRRRHKAGVVSVATQRTPLLEQYDRQAVVAAATAAPVPDMQQLLLSVEDRGAYEREAGKAALYHPHA